MKRTIKRIAPLQAGKMIGILYACMGLVIMPIFVLAAIGGAFAQSAQGQHESAAPAAVAAGVMFGIGLLAPLFYGVLGFVVGVVGAAVYNVVARWIGGIEVDVE
jgi:hypothetical protein